MVKLACPGVWLIAGVISLAAVPLGVMSTQGSSQVAFGKAAAKFNVAESDYLVMASSKIGTFSELAFRFPRAEDFESYMVRILRTRGAYRSEDTIRVYDIASPVPREEYKESDDAACLRRLWTLAAKVAKSEVEALAGDGEEPKTKVSEPTASELEDSTVKDYDRRSLIRLGSPIVAKKQNQ